MVFDLRWSSIVAAAELDSLRVGGFCPAPWKQRTHHCQLVPPGSACREGKSGTELVGAAAFSPCGAACPACPVVQRAQHSGVFWRLRANDAGGPSESALRRPRAAPANAWRPTRRNPVFGRPRTSKRPRNPAAQDGPYARFGIDAGQLKPAPAPARRPQAALSGRPRERATREACASQPAPGAQIARGTARTLHCTALARTTPHTHTRSRRGPSVAGVRRGAPLRCIHRARRVGRGRPHRRSSDDLRGACRALAEPHNPPASAKPRRVPAAARGHRPPRRDPKGAETGLAGH